MSARLSSALRDALPKRDHDYARDLLADPCAYCGTPATLLDHIDPRSRGGRDTWDNLTACCGPCNWSKHDRSLLGFLGTRASRIRERLAALQSEASAWKAVGKR